MKHAKKSPPTKTVVIVTAAVLAVALILVLIIVFMSSGSGDGNTSSAASETPVVTESSAETTEATSSVTETVVPVTTEPASSETATVAPETTPANTTVATDAPVNPIPGDRNTDFSGCLFIGDSRTQGLMMYSGVKGATAYASRGLMVDTFFTTPAVDMNGAKVSVSEAVSQNTGFSHVFIMFGVNELGWPYEDVFRDKYAKVVDHVKAAMPNAKIIVQSIIPVTATKSANDDVYNNVRIELFNSKIRSVCEEKGVTYFDLVPILGTAGGALPEDAAFDGVHLQKPYCEKWLDSLRGAL